MQVQQLMLTALMNCATKMYVFVCVWVFGGVGGCVLVGVGVCVSVGGADVWGV